MENQLSHLLTNASVDIRAMLISLGLGAILGLLIRYHYLKFNHSAGKMQFTLLFPFVLLTTVLIITVIKSSLVLSLGMVGALSIVRFRTPIKEPEELVYIFLSIAAGLGLGAAQFIATSLAVVVILIVIGLIKFKSFNQDISQMYLTVETTDVLSLKENSFDKIHQILLPFCSQAKLKRAQSSAGQMYISFAISMKDEKKCDALIKEIKDSFPGADITIIDSSQILLAR